MLWVLLQFVGRWVVAWNFSCGVLGIWVEFGDLWIFFLLIVGSSPFANSLWTKRLRLLGVTQNFSSWWGGSNGGGDDNDGDERPKPWLILSSEMGKVQSILFVCLSTRKKHRNHAYKLAASFWRYLVVRINSFLLLPFVASASIFFLVA